MCAKNHFDDGCIFASVYINLSGNYLETSKEKMKPFHSGLKLQINFIPFKCMKSLRSKWSLFYNNIKNAFMNFLNCCYPNFSAL